MKEGENVLVKVLCPEEHALEAQHSVGKILNKKPSEILNQKCVFNGEVFRYCIVELTKKQYDEIYKNVYPAIPGSLFEPTESREKAMAEWKSQGFEPAGRDRESCQTRCSV